MPVPKTGALPLGYAPVFDSFRRAFKTPESDAAICLQIVVTRERFTWKNPPTGFTFSNAQAQSAALFHSQRYQTHLNHFQPIMLHLHPIEAKPFWRARFQVQSQRSQLQNHCAVAIDRNRLKSGSAEEPARIESVLSGCQGRPSRALYAADVDTFARGEMTIKYFVSQSLSGETDVPVPFPSARPPIKKNGTSDPSFVRNL